MAKNESSTWLVKFECLTLLIGAADNPNFTWALLLLEVVVPGQYNVHPYVTLWYPTVFSVGTPSRQRSPKVVKSNWDALRQGTC